MGAAAAMTTWRVLAMAPGKEARVIALVETGDKEGIEVARDGSPQPSLRASLVANNIAQLNKQEMRSMRGQLLRKRWKHRFGGGRAPNPNQTRRKK